MFIGLALGALVAGVQGSALGLGTETRQRLSAGLEYVDAIIADLNQALKE